MTLLTVEDLATRSKISKFTWRSWIRQGKVRALHLGRRVRVREEDYVAFLAANATGVDSNGGTEPPARRPARNPRRRA